MRLKPVILRSGLGLSSTADAAHFDNAAIALPNGDLEASVSSPCPVDEDAAAAVYLAHIPEPTTAKKPLALTAGYSSASVEIAADTDVDTDIGLGHRLWRKGHRRG